MKGMPMGGEGGHLPASHPQTSQNGNFKITDFVDIMLSNVLPNLHFSQNQLIISTLEF
jgi:hypothetical protein